MHACERADTQTRVLARGAYRLHVVDKDAHDAHGDGAPAPGTRDDHDCAYTQHEANKGSDASALPHWPALDALVSILGPALGTHGTQRPGKPQSWPRTVSEPARDMNSMVQ